MQLLLSPKKSATDNDDSLCVSRPAIRQTVEGEPAEDLNDPFIRLVDLVCLDS